MNSPPSRRKKATSAASTDSTSPANSANEDISQQLDPGSATITVSAVKVEELTEEEQSDRLALDMKCPHRTAPSYSLNCVTAR